jgi:hypothetical protein
MKNTGLFVAILFIGTLLFSCKQNSKTTTDTNTATENSEVQSSTTETSNVIADETTYSSADEMPRFPGCENVSLRNIEKYVCANNRLNNYISNRLRYPKSALNNKIEGTVTAQFVVRPDGLLDDIAIYNDIGYNCGETVMEIILSMNYMNERWTPGKIGGIPVRVRVAVPVEFRLMTD